MNEAKRPNIPVTLSPELAKSIAEAVEETGFSRSEVMRQSIRIGLPQFRSAYAAATPRPARKCSKR